MGKRFTFTYVSDAKECGLILYDGKTRREHGRFPFPEEKRIGRKWRMELELDDSKDWLYQFREGERRLPDPKGREFISPKRYGEEKAPEDLFGVIRNHDFDWMGTKQPKIPYEDCLIYCLHLRGFTKHATSGVKNRGTFLGVTEKIPYLKEIGVTTLEFQPICEFMEKKKVISGGLSANLNYWGYTEGFYYAPKSDYSKNEPVRECKEMIRALHEAGLEVILQFYFPKEFNPMEIPEILRFWVEEYRVDGFHLIGEDLPADLIARDPELSETKIWYYVFHPEGLYGKRGTPAYKNLGLLRDDFLYEGRRFLKGEENLVSAMTGHLRSIPAALGRINYLSTYWGFTLMDMVSYDFKHNEANGEDNHDGTDYNCSWNCGEEGPSRKKKIRALRLQQIKNALCLLFFAQGTPRIFMGDEFGNSQKGNNNPYCQDNEICWLNWSMAEKNKEILDFFIFLAGLRKDNPILHPAREAQMMDFISCGYPDLSFHGETAWRPQIENYSRQLGVMYCGLYGEKELGLNGRNGIPKKADPLANPEVADETASQKGGMEDGREEFLYLAVNMHWESHRLGLPRLPKGKRWEILFSTCTPCEKNPVEFVSLPPKTTAVYVCREEGTKIEERMETF